MKRLRNLQWSGVRTWVISLVVVANLALIVGCRDKRKKEVSPIPKASGLLTRKILDDSLTVGRRFLLLNQTDEGNFNYEYDFQTKALTRADSQVRQAGATWGVATIHRDQPSDETHAALAHAIQFFRDNSVRTDDGRRFVVYPGESLGRTGTVSLLCLALIDFTATLPEGSERAEMTRLLKEYMKFLLSLRYSEGPHKGHFYATYDYEMGKGVGKPSPYFDGETLLAMAKACREAGMSDLEQPILESAEAMYQRYVTEARKEDEDSDLTKGFYQWSTMAFYEIHVAGWSKSDKFAHRAIELANWMIDVHRTLRRKKNTAYAQEGLISAWELARLIGQEKAQEKIGRAVAIGLYKLTSWQVGGPIPNSYLRKNKTKDPLAVGGIMNSKDDPKLRIDVAQHQMHAVILARRYIYKSADGGSKQAEPNTEQPVTEGELPWSSVGPPLAIKPDDAKAAMKAIWDAMQLDVRVELELPEKLRLDTGNRIVFLSVGTGKKPATVVIGKGRGLKQAMEDAVANSRHMLPNHEDRKLMRLDIVQAVGRRELVHPRGTLRLTLGKNGFVLIGKNTAAFHPEEVVSQALADAKNRIKLENIVLYLGGYDGVRGEVTGSITTPRLIRPFRTAAYYFDGETFRHLYRGHRIPEGITQEALLESLKLAGQYLTGSVSESGRMIYTYNPATAERPNEYNILRHAGTAFSMFDLYATTKDEDLLKAAQRARGYLLEQVQPWVKDGTDAAAIAFGTKIKLGGAALAVIMLVSEMDATGDKEHLKMAQKLTRYLESQQREDGSFVSSRNRKDGSERDFISIYYPGEALLALVRMYSIDKNSRWLDVAERAAHYLIENRDKGKPTEKLPHDHWLLYGLNELYRERPKEIYLNHSRRIVAAMRGMQRRGTWPPDYLGTFYSPPRTTPVATRAEGLLAAHKLFEDHGTKEEAQQALEMIHLAINFELQTQFRTESSMLLDRPPSAVGAFHRGMTHYEIRNDYVQHNISALLELYRYMERNKIEQFGEADWESTKLIGEAKELMKRSIDTRPESK